MTRHYLSVAEVAEVANLSPNTVRSYIRKRMLPPPTVTVGQARGWDLETIENWARARTPYGSGDVDGVNGR